MGGLSEFSPIKREFNHIYANAKKWHSQSVVVYFLAGVDKKFAVVASKKVGNAVLRNRAKRLIRASFLTIKDDLVSGSYVFIAKNPINFQNFDSIKRDILWSLKRLDALK